MVSEQPIQPAGTDFNRRGFLKYTSTLGVAAAITAGLAACGSGGDASGSGAKPATRALGTGAHPKGTITGTLAYLLSGGFDPMDASSAVALAVNEHVFEGLLNLDPATRAPYLALAESMPTASADGLTWTAKLRAGATFSDGTPVTGEDVAWSFNRIIDPANDAIVAGYFFFLESASATGDSATGDSTVEFKFKSPFPLFPTRCAVVKIVPKARTATAAAVAAFNASPVGSGPFKVDSASATTGVVMSNNQRYNGTRPALVTSVVLNTTADDNARLDSLEGDQAQAIEAVPYLDVTTLGGQYEVAKKQSLNQLFLMFNCSAAPFDDKRVRQALFYAIDTEAVINTALNGYGTAATSFLDDANANYQRAATVYNYDPAKAKSLLAAAGASSLSFELVTTATSFIADSAPVIIDYWKQIGLNVTLNTSPTAAVYGKYVPASSFRVLAASGDPSIYGPDPDLLLRWFYYGDTWPVERERWTDAAAKQTARLLDQAAALSGAAQRALWKRVLDIVADEVPLYPVYHVKEITGWNPAGLTDFQATPSTGLYFLGVGRAA
jgi:peptide/nickel transport system substrate-binding protein